MAISILYIVLAGIILCFGFVLLYGAPYLPTLSRQVETALDLLDLKPGQHLIELGCGDGKVLLASARRGIVCTGYELNPILAAVAWLRTRRYGGKVKIVCDDFWRADWPPTDGIYCFILQKHMAKLDTIIMQEANEPIRLVSFAFKILGRKPDKQKDGVFLYLYH